MGQRYSRIASISIALLLIFWYLFTIGRAPERYQWDFSCYRAAGVAARQGLDPYVEANLQPFVSPAAHHLPWIYPPCTLKVARAFAALPYVPSWHLYLALKLTVLALLLYLWNRFFVPIPADLGTVLFLAFAYNGALLWDISSGNATLFEQVCIWAGFAALVMRRPWLFAACIAFGAQIKWVPLALLPVVLLIDRRQGWKPLVAGIVLFALPAGFYAARYPGWTVASVQLSWGQSVSAPIGTSILNLLSEIYAQATTGVPTVNSPALPAIAVYALVAGAILVVSCRAVWRMGTESRDSRSLALLFLALTFSLITPRTILYNNIIALPATLYAIQSFNGPGVGMRYRYFLVFAATFLPPPLDQLHWIHYISLVARIVLWWDWLQMIQTRVSAASIPEATGKAVLS